MKKNYKILVKLNMFTQKTRFLDEFFDKKSKNALKSPEYRQKKTKNTIFKKKN